MVDDRENLDPDDKKEDSFEFDSAGEAVGYISMAQARVLTMRTARDEPGSYGASYEGVDMVFTVVGQDEDEDYFHIRLSYQPVSDFQGEPGVEEFVIDKTGTVEFRQILGMPKPVGSQLEREQEEKAQRELELAAQREREEAARREQREQEEVVFPDKNLEAGVREALEKPVGPLTRGDLKRLEELTVEKRGVEDLTGLEHAVNLTILSLLGNQISDVSPLTSLTNLTELYLNVNQISDVSPLASLTNLTTLALGQNQISDISPLTSLTNLTTLHLVVNQISDVSPLASLTNLTELFLSHNQISDVSPLASLTNLTNLNLENNPIKNNWLVRNAHVSALRARGVDVSL